MVIRTPGKQAIFGLFGIHEAFFVVILKKEKKKEIVKENILSVIYNLLMTASCSH